MAMRNFGIVAMALAFVVGSCWGGCPSRDESLVLDVEEFADNWYLVAASSMDGTRVTNCSGLMVFIEGLANIKGAFSLVSLRDGNPQTYIVNVQNDNDGGTWRLAGTELQRSFKHRVIAAVYDEYISLVICPNDEQNDKFNTFGMIFSRSKTLPPLVLNELKNKVGVYVGVNNIHSIQHDRCEPTPA